MDFIEREREKDEMMMRRQAEMHQNQMQLLVDQVENQKRQNEELMQSLTSLMQQFNDSKNGIIEYLRDKPIKDIAVKEDLVEIVEKAKRDLNLDTENCFNFAFVGHTKTGKSSLINALRGIPDNHSDAAKVGVTETTHEIAPYSFTDPGFEHVKIYDIPGAGTLTHNANSYFQ